MNVIWFEGNWNAKRVIDHAPVAIDSIVVHSFEVENPKAPPLGALTFQNKDTTYVQTGACGNVLASWSERKIGSHYIISSESIAKIMSDLEAHFPDLNDRAFTGQYAVHVHDPQDIALICCVRHEDAAFHAGISHFGRFGSLHPTKTRYTLNFSSIGIELQGNGFYEGDKSKRNFDQFWPQQITMLRTLIKSLAKEYNLNTITDVLTHSTIAPLRKKDPGRYFPFEALAKEGIGWILKEPYHKEEKAPCVDHARKLLIRIGYQLPECVSLKNLEGTIDKEKQFGCLLPSSDPEVVWSTLDGFALQYAPWAWYTRPLNALCLNEVERGRVVKALEHHLESATKVG